MITRHMCTAAGHRGRPANVTLMADWPIIAQLAMPPTKATAMLALTCLAHSRRFLLLLWVILGRRVRAPAAALPVAYISVCLGYWRWRLSLSIPVCIDNCDRLLWVIQV